tara:strand:- start:147009 stop:148898 length:1890 start_codon:yes stop_codon:yes gene_type:complete
MTKLITLSFLAIYLNSALGGNYCAGIRGNGELAPAHWGSLSRIIEHKDLPKTVAGGSSAAITLFFLDAISRNEEVSARDEDERKNQRALMFKTLVPHIMYIGMEDVKVPKIMKMVGNVMGIGDDGFIAALGKAVKVAKDLPMFFDVLGEYGPLLNPELASGLRKNFSFYKGQIAEAIKVFGSFDAKNDMNLFYRKGLVDFKYLGVLTGRIADFYAGYADEQTNEKLQYFLDQCAEDSRGRSWPELMAKNPVCQKLFVDSLQAYYGPKYETRRVRRLGGRVTRTIKTKIPRTFPNKMVFEEVGSGIDAYPTTSVIIGDAVQRYKEKLAEYESKDAQGVEDFSLDFNLELKYAYWGRTHGLDTIKDGLKQHYPNDAKSSLFKPIDGGTWFEVLSTSPAEPGLSNLQRVPNGPAIDPSRVINKSYFYSKSFFFFSIPTFTAQKWFNEDNQDYGVIPFREEMFSAGGWSDLHPTLVLKARGCEDIVYITRQGGESVFGQQVFIRLTGYTDKISFWKDIKKGNRNGWINLSDEEEKSPWNQLYNLMNPESSYNKSIGAATAIYCTDWDKFSVLKGEIQPTLDDAYHAPVFVKDGNRAEYDFGYDFEGKSPDGFPGCILKDFDQPVKATPELSLN